jgi:hypothetical protein
MREPSDTHVSDLLRRITGESEARDAVHRVARELRHRHEDLRTRRPLKRSAETPERNARSARRYTPPHAAR